MNFLSNLSIYDGLCKLCVGVLLLARLPFTIDASWLNNLHGLIEALVGIVFLIVAFIIGNLWHHLLIEKLLKFLTNDERAIRDAYRKVYNKKEDDSLKLEISKNPNIYFEAYYKAESCKLLSTVHILEVLEAFMRSSIPILFFYAGALLMWLNISKIQIDSMLRTVFSIGLIALPFLCIKLRDTLQEKIYHLVWETYLYIETLKQN